MFHSVKTMSFLAYCDFCDYQHRCRKKTRGKTISCRQCGQPFVAEPGQSDVDSLRSYQPELRRKKDSPPEIQLLESDLSVNESDQLKKTFSLWCAGGCLIIAAGLAIYGWTVDRASGPVMFRFSFGFLLVAVTFVLDWHYRCRISAEVESFGGVVHRIRWQPWQGMIGTRGYSWSWRRRKLKFYQVDYVDRDGKSQSGLCGISWLCGSDWDW